MTSIQKWIYDSRPKGEISPQNYRLVQTDETLAPVRGEVVVEGVFWSVDPYMRIQQSAKDTWEPPHPLGEVQNGGVVGRVTEVGDGTKGLQIGDWVETFMGWRTHGVLSAVSCRKLDPEIAPVSTALHVLGMPGRIAYFGLTEAGKPRPGETLLVSGAAGAVGSIVGQVGKLAGLHVVGVVGTEEKARWIVHDLGFDAAINYCDHQSAGTMVDAFCKVAPNGIDIYYDNTGGYTTDAVIQSMNLRARIIICGQISQYQGGLDDPNTGPRLLHHFLYKRATLQGVLARDFTARMDEMLTHMGPWVRDGKIRYHETIIDGFNNLPKALCGLFEGANTGKMLVKV